MTALRGNVSLAKMLILHPEINIDLKDKGGRTALDLAEKYNYGELATLFRSYSPHSEQEK